MSAARWKRDSVGLWLALLLVTLGATVGFAHGGLQALVPHDDELLLVSAGHENGSWGEHVEAPEGFEEHSCQACWLFGRVSLAPAPTAVGEAAPASFLRSAPAPAATSPRLGRGPSPRAPPSC